MHDFYIHNSEEFVTLTGIRNGSRLVPARTVLFVVRGMSLAKEFRIGITKRKVSFNQDLKAILPFEGIDPLYLAYALKGLTPIIMSFVDEASHGTRRLSTEALGKLLVPIPEIAEQTRIAKVLQYLDDKIELNRQMNQTLEAIAQAIFKSWFVDFDPVWAKMEGRDYPLDAETIALFPDHFEDSDLGPIPAGWRIRLIGEISNVVGGGTPSTKNPAYWEEGIHYFATPKNLASLRSSILLKTDRKVTDAGLEMISSGLLPIGTVLLSSRAPVGYLALSGVELCINQGFIAMECEGPISNYFALNWAHSNMRLIKANAGGTTFAEISKRNFRPLPVILPKRNLIGVFDGMAKHLYKQITVNERESGTLAELRDTLLPKFISGEIRVPEAGTTLEGII